MLICNCTFTFDFAYLHFKPQLSIKTSSILYRLFCKNKMVGLMLLLLCLQYPLKAQSISGVRAYFANDSVVVKMGQVFDNHLIIDNATNKELHLKLERHDSLALIPLPDTIIVGKRQKRKLYLQYLAEPKLFERIGDSYRVGYQGTEGLMTAAFSFLSKEESKVELTFYNNTYFMDPKANELRVQVLCKNAGIKNVSMAFKAVSYPQGMILLNGQSYYELAPGEQKLIDLMVKIDQRQVAAMDYNLEISAINQNDPAKGSLGSRRLKVVQLGSHKTWGNTGIIDGDFIGHQYELSYRQSGSNYSYTHLMGEGAINVTRDNNLQYRFNYNGYLKPSLGNEIYDSYLKFETSKLSVALGSISENMDYNLYGQGAKVGMNWGGRGEFSALYVKRNYLIYSDLYNSLPQEEDIAVQYKWDPSKRKIDSFETKRLVNQIFSKFLGPFEIHYIHGNDPLTTTLKHIVGGQITFNSGKWQHILIEGGVSREYFQPTNSYSRHKDGWSGGVHYNGNWNGFNLSSDNYYSSPYYSGIRRGALSLNEAFSLNLKRGWLTSWQFNQQKNGPSYMDNYYAYSNPKTDRVQYSWSIARNETGLSISFKPYYLEQSLNQIFMAAPVAFSSTAVRGELNLVKSFRNNQLSLSSDYGWVNTGNPFVTKNKYQSWRLLGSYNYKIFSMNASLQNGPFYIMEEEAPWQYSGYKNYSIGPSVHLTGLNNTLKFEAADYLNYNGYQRQWNHNLSANGQYQLRQDILVKADIYMNVYSNSAYKNFTQFSIGIQKTFRKQNAPGHHSWRVQFFKDLNANGKWDKREDVLPNVVAQVGEMQVKSMGSGKVTLVNLPDAHYDLQLVDGQGWSLPRSVAIDLNKNTKNKIGLIECTSVNGHLIVDTSSSTGKVPILEGVLVELKELNTGKLFTTYSNANGDFEFWVPKGDYAARIPGENNAFTVREIKVPIIVNDKNNPEIIFHIKDRSRAVDVQEF